jgi:hypothetical protein
MRLAAEKFDQPVDDRAKGGGYLAVTVQIRRLFFHNAKVTL